MFVISKRYRKVVFSHETALMLHGLMEHEVNEYSLTVPRGYNTTALRNIGCSVSTLSEEIYNIGITSVKDAFGNIVPVYDVERTICDVIKNKNKIDIQLFQNALKEYCKMKDKNLHNLMIYAKKLKIEEKVRNYVEVLI